MQTVGIIVEYNPMHNGHVHHIEQSRRISGAEAVVAVMSGHFLQRGEPAVCDKWARTDMALAQGVDLVLELPVAYAVQPAEWFAYGGVATLEATGVVDALCFGSEIGSMQPLEAAAAQLADEPAAFAELLQAGLKAGSSYPKAYAEAAGALARQGGATDAVQAPPQWLAEPNNSLGLHYMMALRRLGSAIRPYTIERVKAGYHDQQVNDSPIASATAIRKLVFGNEGLSDAAAYMPESSLQVLKQLLAEARPAVHWNSFSSQLFYRLATMSPYELESILEVTEGLEYRLLQSLPELTSPDVNQLLSTLKTKRYTHTKLQRMLTHILLGHSKEAFGPEALRLGPSYIRVLGFTERGQALLKRMKRTASLPVIQRMTRENAKLGGANGIAADARATAVYHTAFPLRNGRAAYRDYYESPRRPRT